LLGVQGCSESFTLVAGGGSEPAPLESLEVGAAGKYRIASWNVRNLFDPVDDSYGDEVLQNSEYEEKLQALVAVMEQVDADFWGLQEVENLACLEDLNERLSHPYPLLGLIEGNDHSRGIDVAFLSRLPVSEVVSHRERDLPDHPEVSKNYSFSRDCLEVRLESRPPVTLLVNHLKSSMGNAKRSAAKRRVQAEAIAEIVSEVDQPPQRVVVVLGDFNDRPDSWSLEPLFEKLEDPFASLGAKQRITHRYRGGGGALDHILTDGEGNSVVSDARVWKGIAKKTSDHDPVSVELTLSLPVVAPSERTWTE